MQRIPSSRARLAGTDPNPNAPEMEANGRARASQPHHPNPFRGQRNLGEPTEG